MSSPAGSVESPQGLLRGDRRSFVVSCGAAPPRDGSHDSPGGRALPREPVGIVHHAPSHDGHHR